ncbi:hypothetical protein CIB84_017345 [Bambusicola thoracicus]|nr:hypothetical protein CIB84_017345 [Bambusicola thoracicus]
MGCQARGWWQRG